MAVFPDRIVLKSTTDAPDDIVDQIQAGGTDPIQSGELVIGREQGLIRIYSLDSQGEVVQVAGSTQKTVVAGTVERTSETQVSDASGNATYSALGASGTLVSLLADATAWVTIYMDEASRTADDGRAYGTDLPPGLGILADYTVPNGSVLQASPGVSYFNGETPETENIYVRVRSTLDGTPLNGTSLTITAYAHQNFGGYGANRAQETVNTVSGVGVFTGLGTSGQLMSISSTQTVWVRLYSTMDALFADRDRLIAVDPLPGYGVLFDAYIEGNTVYSTPGAYYFNADDSPTEAIYVATTDNNGAQISVGVTMTGYAEASYTGVSGGTYGTG